MARRKRIETQALRARAPPGPEAATAAVQAQPSEINLLVGDPAPWFTQRSPTNPTYVFDTAGGRYIVLCFFGSATSPRGRRALDAVMAQRALFNDSHASFFGVSTDPGDEAEARISNMLPGVRFLWDFDHKVSDLYGALKDGGLWVVLDPTLRVIATATFAADGGEAGAVLGLVRALPPPDHFTGIELQAPVLYLPNVFERSFCDYLISLYEQDGGQASGFMRDVDGKTVHISDPGHKRRRDCTVVDPQAIDYAKARVNRTIIPEIHKVFQFQVTRMERHLVACYGDDEQGFFAPHRDNTTLGTAHRRFAVSINLNQDFEGGDIRFPEYGQRGFRPPVGGAVVFSCSLLHAVAPVTRGRRFAFLPFLYDDSAAQVRERHNAYLAPNIATYKA